MADYHITATSSMTFKVLQPQCERKPHPTVFKKLVIETESQSSERNMHFPMASVRLLDGSDSRAYQILKSALFMKAEQFFTSKLRQVIRNLMSLRLVRYPFDF